MLNQVKIIGGQWRGRRIHFSQNACLRPTPSRLRETLFNWLAPIIHDAVFLDAFGGSGALSFEALSRGATRGDLIEPDLRTREHTYLNTSILKTDRLTIIDGSSPTIFTTLQPEKAYDIVFLDPPFHHNLLLNCLQTLKNLQLIHSQSLIYFEVEKSLAIEALVAEKFDMIKDKHTNRIRYGLLKLTS